MIVLYGIIERGSTIRSISTDAGEQRAVTGSEALWVQAVNVIEGGTPDTCGQLSRVNRMSTARVVCRDGEGKVRAATSVS